MKRRRDAGEKRQDPPPGDPMKRQRSLSWLRSSSAAAQTRRKRARRPPPAWGGEKNAEQFRLLGNYDSRPGYSPGGGGLGKYSDSDAWRDERLDVLPASLFCSADVLDVGCGAGYTSILIAERYAPRSVLGIDIDRVLVSQARTRIMERATMLLAGEAAERNLSDSVALETAASVSSGASVTLPLPESIPLSVRLIQGVTAAELSTHAQAPLAAPPAGDSRAIDDVTAAPPGGTRFLGALARVSFARGDFLGIETGGVAPPTGSYDVVLCLGVTKWVALNYGDEGILRLFGRLRDALRPGGRLVLEAQRWSSYKKRSSMTPHVARTFAGIRLRPANYVTTLLGDGPGGGFAELESTHTVGPGGRKHRELLVLRKPL